jgi:Tol biopolymer transport system component
MRHAQIAFRGHSASLAQASAEVGGLQLAGWLREAPHLRLRRWLSAVVGIVGIAIAIAALWTRGSATSGGIVFQAQVNGVNQLFTIHPDGTGLKQITHLVVTDRQVSGAEAPRWSPDGKLIIFDSGYDPKPKQKIGLFTIRPNGRELKRLPLVTGLYNAQPEWSPDGKQIAYTLEAGDRSADRQGIEVTQADGSFPYALTRRSKIYIFDGDPAWSPNGDWIAFTEDYGPTAAVIMKVRDVGGNPIELTRRDLNAANPRWSPDGRKILFNSHNPPQPGQDANLYTMNANGKNLRQLSRYKGGKLHAFANGWSPDGTQIVYHLRGTLRNGRNIDQLFTIQADGRNNRQLTHLPNGSSPSHGDWH